MRNNSELFPRGCIAPDKIEEGDLIAYLDGEASAEVAHHIATCPACAFELETLREMNALFLEAINLSPLIDTTPATNTLHQNNKLDLFEPVAYGSSWLQSLFQRSLKLGYVVTTMLLFLTIGLGVYHLSTPHRQQRSQPTAIVESQNTSQNNEGVTRAVIPVQNNEPIAVTVSTPIISEEAEDIAPPIELRLAMDTTVQQKTTVSVQTSPERAYIMDHNGKDYQVWAHNNNGVTRLYFAVSEDQGKSWSEDIKIDTRVGRVLQAQLAMDIDNNLYVIWRNWYNIDGGAYYFAHSEDGGKNWSNARRIGDSIGDSFHPDLAVDDTNGDLFVTWQSQRNASTGVYFTRSDDGGRTWSDRVRMANIGS